MASGLPGTGTVTGLTEVSTLPAATFVEQPALRVAAAWDGAADVQPATATSAAEQTAARQRGDNPRPNGLLITTPASPLPFLGLAGRPAKGLPLDGQACPGSPGPHSGQAAAKSEDSAVERG
jgi:hypothetical protein